MELLKRLYDSTNGNRINSQQKNNLLNTLAGLIERSSWTHVPKSAKYIFFLINRAKEPRDAMDSAIASINQELDREPKWIKEIIDFVQLTIDASDPSDPSDSSNRAIPIRLSSENAISFLEVLTAKRTADEQTKIVQAINLEGDDTLKDRLQDIAQKQPNLLSSNLLAALTSNWATEDTKEKNELNV